MSGDKAPTRRWRHSLRTRFLLAILIWTMIGIGAIWLSANRLFAKHVEMQYHEELEVHLRELARLTHVDAGGHPELLRPLSDPRYEVPLSGFYWQVTVPGKRPLRSASMTRGMLDESIAHSPEILHRVENGPTGPTITYGFIRPAPTGGSIHYVIATDERELNRVISGFTNELTLWLAVLAAALLLTGGVIIRIGVAPLDRLATAISRLRGGGTVRLEGQYPAEIAPLVDDLNAYIRQNGEIIARARVQAGNLAHSLRTPLAVITDEAERMAERGDAAQSAQVLLDQSRMMAQQIEYQLARARSAAGTRIPGATSVLPDLIDPIVAAMRRLHPDIAFDLLSRPAGSVTLSIDPVDLSELLSILLDNAGKWAAHAVSVTLEEGEDGLAIEVVDDGPGMTPAQIAEAFAVGSRFDESKVGTGLGLAIARDICEAIGADIRLMARADGAAGLRVRLILPR